MIAGEVIAGKMIAGKTNVAGLSIDEIRGAIVEERTTATALASEFYDRMKKEDAEIGAFLTLCEDRALKQAGLIDQMAEKSQKKYGRRLDLAVLPEMRRSPVSGFS